MNETVKRALMTKREAALALGINLDTTKGQTLWKHIVAKARDSGEIEAVGRGKHRCYSYKDVQTLARIMRKPTGNREVREELVAMVKKQLMDDGY